MIPLHSRRLEVGVASLWDLAVPQGGSWIAGQEGLSVRQRQTSKKTVGTSTEHSHGVLQGCRCRRGSLGGLQSVVVITPHPAPAVPPTPICSGNSPAQKQVHVPCISCWEHGQRGDRLNLHLECWHLPAGYITCLPHCGSSPRRRRCPPRGSGGQTS